mgnify:CR=1 FL=1
MNFADFSCYSCSVTDAALLDVQSNSVSFVSSQGSSEASAIEDSYVVGKSGSGPLVGKINGDATIDWNTGRFYDELMGISMGPINSVDGAYFGGVFADPNNFWFAGLESGNDSNIVVSRCDTSTGTCGGDIAVDMGYRTARGHPRAGQH